MISAQEILATFQIENKHKGTSTGSKWTGDGDFALDSHSPIDGTLLATVGCTSPADYQQVVQAAQKASLYWKTVPAPKRGEVIRQLGEKLRIYKEPLGALVSMEMGKSLQEGLGEVQEMIDICEFAVGLSRQLYGLTMHSERPNHRMYEQWHPLGIVGIISAFNFPVAVWAWNTCIAAICGNVTIWKPSEKTPLTAVACFQILSQVVCEQKLPEGIFNLVTGDGKTIGRLLTEDPRVSLISATGSTAMGKTVAQVVGARFGKTILELGGNNAVIVTPHADLKLAIPALVFGAVGTAGQRCTTTRRVIVHESIFAQVQSTLVKAYQSLRIGNPLETGVHVGPLIDTHAVAMMQHALQQAQEQGGEIIWGGKPVSGPAFSSGCYVEPALVLAAPHMLVVQEETFAPILYLLSYSGDVEEAIAIQNNVRQGLSSSIFTTNLQEAEAFLSARGSDCGIANVNIGTSGAEIGGAFGGEKETGGGRESGSDAWKAYMRRQTNTINYGKELPLAQGIQFF